MIAVWIGSLISRVVRIVVHCLRRLLKIRLMRVKLWVSDRILNIILSRSIWEGRCFRRYNWGIISNLSCSNFSSNRINNNNRNILIRSSSNSSSLRLLVRWNYLRSYFKRVDLLLLLQVRRVKVKVKGWETQLRKLESNNNLRKGIKNQKIIV